MAAVEIPLSQINQFGGRDQFDVAIANHIANMQAFTKSRGTPRPIANPLVEMALLRVTHPITERRPDEYVPNYTVVDDTPPPPAPLNLDDQKHQLAIALHVAEVAAQQSLLPQRKRRLLILTATAALSKKEEDRTVAENKLVAKFNTFQRRVADLALIAAQAESDIEDLTDANISSWQQPTFG